MTDTTAAAGQNSSIWPGLALTALIAAVAFGLRLVPGVDALSPLILSILLGMALHNTIGTRGAAKPGVTLSLKVILKAGIVLLGLQLTTGQVIEVGLRGVGIIAATLVATFVFTKWLGRRLGVGAGLTELIAAGTAVCGASAVIATNTVTRASDEDVAYAVACVTVFGSLSMVLIPVVEATLLHLGPDAYGLWSGAVIHEVAQVVAAAFQQGDAAGHTGTIAKLTRVMMLAPLVLALSLLARQRSEGASGSGATIPWFVFGFIAMVGVASSGIVPAAAEPWHRGLTQFLLAMALAAMGLETDIRKLAAEGARPAILGAASWLFIVALGLGLVLFLAPGG
ncbi:YeiH family protein [Paracoccus sp. TK19116]|uniref:YeiH family protein n=1 Tax=Paracoccus albicereus TaxID=2922394 RepID=A0ABT1MRH3_9RHOB|nr:YeiH family protein [Paracoccus albicereus]MCQ0970116.1 YeiH family protein [Paracoccus albicereus]